MLKLTLKKVKIGWQIMTTNNLTIKDLNGKEITIKAGSGVNLFKDSANDIYQVLNAGRTYSIDNQTFNYVNNHYWSK